MNDRTLPPLPARWDDLAAFLAVAQAGGLSSAARATGASAPTLGRRMRALERALGRELFARRSHGYDLTEEGRALKKEVEAIHDRIARITALPAGGSLPLVKLSAGTWTALALARHIGAIIGDPPDLRLRFVSSEVRLSLNRREAAIGLRNRRPTETGLAGRRLGRVAFAAYQAPGAPPPHWIRVLAETPSARWVLAQPGLVAHEVSHPRLALDMALAGAGRAVLPTFIGDAEPTLERASPAIDPLAHDQWLVTHDEDRHLSEIRRTIDRLTRVLSGKV
ncbi:MAG: LysR family transcriptional regulator [Pseudomonadota bacterium]